MPIFSVIMPVCHGGQLLIKALACLRGLEFPSGEIEVIVCDVESDADSGGAVASEARTVPFSMRYVPSGSGGRAAALNAACALASGTYLAFVDDDAFPEPDWLVRLQEVLEDEPNVGIVGGVDELIGGLGSFDLAFDVILNSFLATGSCRRGRSVRLGKYYPRLWNMAMPRKLALEIAAGRGGCGEVFDEGLAVHEDVELGDHVERLGKRLVFAEQARVIHRRETTFLDMFRRDLDMARTCRALGIHRLPHMILLGGALTVVVLAFLMAFFPACGLALLLVVGVYVVVVGAVAVKGFLRTRRLAVLLLVPLVLVSLHAARVFGYIIGRRCRDGAVS